MDIKLYNTLTNRVDLFEPIKPGVMRMYNCGPTVYDYAHIGNFRTFMFADLLRRFFEFAGYQVIQVMNLTDVGHMTEDQLADGGGQDKMELAAKRLKQAKKQGVADVENPDDPYQVAKFFIDAFSQDSGLLGMRISNEVETQMPRATQHIGSMIVLIEKLVDKKHAYVASDGAVYYDVVSFPDYGRLSGNTLDKLQIGAGGRIDEEQNTVKKHPADFLLWKPDDSHLMKWDSPWGVGYPGWHIECSAMAMELHGCETIDIHTGGEDNIFPHHECEIAQSTGATGKPFANYWMHARHLMVDGEKMSKSKGTCYTIDDLLKRNVDPATLRFELLKAPYRTNANFTFKGLEDSDKTVRRLRAVADVHPEIVADDCPKMGDTDVELRFAEALADDLNISGALGAINAWLNEIAGKPSCDDVATLRRLDHVLGVIDTLGRKSVTSEKLSDNEIDNLCKQLDVARSEKNYAKSDAIRDQLIAADVEVRIANTGTTWQRKMILGE